MRVPSSTPAGMLTDSVRSRLHLARAVAVRAGLSMISPRPRQRGQVRSMAKKPCCARTRPWPPQVVQVSGFGAGLGARARTGLAGDRGRHFQARRLAGEGLLERDLQVVAQVGAAARGRSARPRRPMTVAEEIVEDVAHRGGEALAHAEPPPPFSKAGMAEAIVGRALLRVRQRLIGLVDFLEADLRCRIAGIAVGMALHRRLAEGGFQLRIGGAAGDAKRLVIITFGHCFGKISTLVPGNRRSCRVGRAGFHNAARENAVLDARPYGARSGHGEHQ